MRETRMRDLFHVPDNYFLNHSVGCMPRGAKTALDDGFFAAWTSGTNWDDWMGVLDEFRAGLAGLLGVNATSICPQSNISSALTKILYSLPEGRKKTILLSPQDFPTIGFVFKQAERMGFRLRLRRRMTRRFQTNPRQIRLILEPHCRFTTRI